MQRIAAKSAGEHARRGEDGPDRHAEGLAALVALVNANARALALHLANALDAAAMRTNGAAWAKPGPQDRHRRLLRRENVWRPKQSLS